MDVLQYIVDKALVLIPVLNIIGMVLKGIQKIPDKYIPLILLVLGVLGTCALTGFSTESVVQGVLVTGAAVYGNQIVKQFKKDE